MKSFKNINILIEVKLFCLKNIFFLQKSSYLKEKYVFEIKEKIFFKKILAKDFGKNFLEKTFFQKFLEKNFCLP